VFFVHVGCWWIAIEDDEDKCWMWFLWICIVGEVLVVKCWYFVFSVNIWKQCVHDLGLVGWIFWLTIVVNFISGLFASWWISSQGCEFHFRAGIFLFAWWRQVLNVFLWICIVGEVLVFCSSELQMRRASVFLWIFWKTMCLWFGSSCYCRLNILADCGEFHFRVGIFIFYLL